MAHPNHYLADGKKKIHLKSIPTDAPKHIKDDDLLKEEAKLFEKMEELQSKLYADSKKSILIVLQAMDAAGKDGTIKKVFSGLNPQAVHVVSFKEPSKEELSHDYLWRIHQHVPPRGLIGIFNRSHYEDVLIARVEKMVPEKVWRRRYDEINQFEAYLHDNDVVILKFFLHISKDEQRRRFLKRLENPQKYWKFSHNDIDKRKDWDKYQKAYEDAINACSASHAPWFIIPANDKAYRNVLVARAIVEALEEINPKYPKPLEDLTVVKIPG